MSDVDILKDKADIVTAELYPTENLQTEGDADEKRGQQECPGLYEGPL